MFGKQNKENKKEEKKEAQSFEQSKFNEHDLHVMPSKFLPEHEVTSMGPVKKIALILVIIIVVLAAGIGGAVWFLNKDKDSKQNVNTVNAVNNANANTNININTNQNTNTNTDTNTNTNTNTNQNTNTDTNTNQNTNTSPEPASDTDNDGLSRLEELLFKTNLNRADTDRDGYRDGLEVSSLYDPLVPNHNLIDSGLVTKYISDQFSYSVLRPKEWLSQAMDQNVQKILFLPDSETGEFFSVEATANEQNLTLADYQVTLSGDFENFSLGGVSAIRSIDGLKIYAVHGNYIYAIVYEIQDAAAANFETTFEMLLKSFAWQ